MSKAIRKEKVFEIARKKEAVEKDLAKFTELKEEAFKVFDCSFWATLKNIQKSYDSGAWNELLSWKDCVFNSENEEAIREAFQQLSTATINRKEFHDKLSGCRDDIEKYLQDLTNELQKLERQLDKAYDDFVQNETGEYKWIFEHSFVKEIVLKFQLTETETETE